MAKFIKYRPGISPSLRLVLNMVVITWLWLTGMKFCPVLPGSQQCYKLFINYILLLHVKSVIPAWRDPSFVLLWSRFAGTKFSDVIASARLRGMKKLINTAVWKDLFLKHRRVTRRVLTSIDECRRVTDERI